MAISRCFTSTRSRPPTSHVSNKCKPNVFARAFLPRTAQPGYKFGTQIRRTSCPVVHCLPEDKFCAAPHGVVDDNGAQSQLDLLTALQTRLIGASSEDQVKLLRRTDIVNDTLNTHSEIGAHIDTLPYHQQAALLSAIACGQGHVVCVLGDGNWQGQMTSLAKTLTKVMHFYDSLGGIVGYQLKCLQLIREANAEEAADSAKARGSSGDHPTQTSTSQSATSLTYLVPEGPVLQGEAGRTTAHRAAGEGLRALKYLAEIYPVGGAGDRLGLVCEETGEPLPAAMLKYCGRSMLEGLIRDLQAREYLHYRVFGRQYVTPIAIMTSDAKGNHARVSAVLDAHDNFGRPAHSIRTFCQPLVPVMEAETGTWVLPEPLKPNFKPGGHGAIWKLMWDKGIFQWLSDQKREAAIIRQISNPMASTDCTLLALTGTGFRDSRAFGFASCDRAVGAAEGMNVLVEHHTPAGPGSGDKESFKYGITNVEYTEFERLGICDKAVSEHSNQSCFPANTNILYVGLRQAEAAVRAGIKSGGDAVFPGMIFNLSKKISYTCAVNGHERNVRAGRMECTMQNLADELLQQFPERLAPGEASELDTFVVYNERRCVTSSAKRKLQPGSTHIHQTPDGSFLDLMRNAHDVLTMGGVSTPDPGTTDEYLANGPRFIFLFHPALGPMWQVISQKMSGGSLARHAEVVLEVAELCWRDVHVDGSLLVKCDQALGHWAYPTAHHEVTHIARAVRSHDTAPAYQYSDQCGRVRMSNVRVHNEGVDFAAPDNRFWAHRVTRREACRVVLEGRSEFDAKDVTIRGDVEFTVPHGFRMVVRGDSSQQCGYTRELVPLGEVPSWSWSYTLEEDGCITLELSDADAHVPMQVSRVGTAASTVRQ